MRSDTGEILRSREELAEKVGMTPRHLSETMTELASINAILRKKDGRAVRYFMNPNIARTSPRQSSAKRPVKTQARFWC